MREFSSDGEPISRNAPYGAVIVIFKKITGEILLLKRKKCTNNKWLWGPPYGSRKPFEDIDQCAIRELYEEVSVSPELVKVTEKEQWHLYVGFMEDNQLVNLSEEHDEFLWVSERALKEYIGNDIILFQLKLAIEYLGRKSNDNFG
ncbi:NUDIX hydrolase [Listeria grandensis]|uniref:NUDIX hydrolase n=1 Tax=Listeria grandensis TaxID=1494963 RepID=A0A7X0Y4M9_9LIST|nr:NUDIX hydrolase [Listeria grandensis]MBC1936708.1 NUDIX hydrolase [Listeria grandensis]